MSEYAENISELFENINVVAVARFLLAFSWLTNLERLFDTSLRPGTMTSLQGIRFFSMTWIILGHGISFIATNTCELVILVLNYV